MNGRSQRWQVFPSLRPLVWSPTTRLDGSLADASGQHHDGKAVRGDIVYDEGKVDKAAEFSGETQVDFAGAGDFDRGDRFSLALWARLSTSNAVKLIQKRNSAENWQGYEILIDDPTYSIDDPTSTGQRDRISHFIVRLAGSWPEQRH